MDKVENSKCDKCGNIEVIMDGFILLNPDSQPYNNIDYEETKTDCQNIEKLVTARYCEYCEVITDISLE